MDFYIHDNIETYNKRYTYNGLEQTRLDVTEIYIPESGAFWFKTDWKMIENNVNLQNRYLHIHEGLTQFVKMQFDIEPHKVKRTELSYNPENKCIEINIPKRFFGKNNIFKKKCLYKGIALPKRPVTILGNVMYNMDKREIHFVLNYYPQGQGLKFHFEEEDEPATMEQKMKIEELEEKIRIEEAKIDYSKMRY